MCGVVLKKFIKAEAEGIRYFQSIIDVGGRALPFRRPLHHLFHLLIRHRCLLANLLEGDPGHIKGCPKGLVKQDRHA
ncbi:hypothetical protein CG51_06000 [Haematobacter missouriensis]|uniref:Uncharacterized protein n=1 Tax=Haematobacter missouriensis TaxID=366616 RepID=A0A212AQS8_9RHOB|nr:hypothetical protein CG51_06000 [Haematobacter missouriensis]OWJ73908.1 hypothetical protein CDV53_14355 [Haematobacter missouriensis]OWJ83795.1 hypothetical protein CDV52_09810 [Haematobacter missouriensis]